MRSVSDEYAAAIAAGDAHARAAGRTIWIQSDLDFALAELRRLYPESELAAAAAAGGN